MELSQRTGQLSIVSVMGRGTPVTVNLLPRSRAVKKAVSLGINERAADSRQRAAKRQRTARRHGDGERRRRGEAEVSGVRCQVSEVGGRRTEIRLRIGASRYLPSASLGYAVIGH